MLNRMRTHNVIMNCTGLHLIEKTDRIWECVLNEKKYMISGLGFSILKHVGLKKTAFGKTKNLQEN